MREDDRGPVRRSSILVDDVADAAAPGTVGQPAELRMSAAGVSQSAGAPALPAANLGGTADALDAGAGHSANRTIPPNTVTEPTGHDTDPDRTAGPDGSPPEPADAASLAVRPSGAVDRAAVNRPEPRWVAVTGGPEPSWAKVLGTTISLWTTRRLRRLGIGRRRSPRPGTSNSYGAPPDRTRQRSARRWRLAAGALAVVVLTLVAVQLSGVLTGNGAGRTTARPQGAGAGASSLLAAARARAGAAAWIAQQVTGNDIIACDPVMCSALQDDGVAAGRLLSLKPTAADPLGADVVAATPAIRSQFGGQLVSEYAPALIASFGSGATRVDVRAIADDGGAAFRTAAQSDLTARKAAGAQLLHNGRLHITAQGAGQIAGGEVDSRLVVTLAALASQRAVRVTGFSDTAPGAPLAYREVTITSAGGKPGASGLAADLSQVRAQHNPYLPAYAGIVHLAGGQSALRIEFGAPNLLGLLSGGTST